MANMDQQIWMHCKDHNILRILWWQSPKEQIKEYQLTTVIYRTASAPLLANNAWRNWFTSVRSVSPGRCDCAWRLQCWWGDQWLHNCSGGPAATRTNSMTSTWSWIPSVETVFDQQKVPCNNSWRPAKNLACSCMYHMCLEFYGNVYLTRHKSRVKHASQMLIFNLQGNPGLPWDAEDGTDK